MRAKGIRREPRREEKGMKPRRNMMSSFAKSLQVSVLAFVMLLALATPHLPQASAATYSVSIVDFAFQPNFLLIELGDTVVWTNTVSTPHTTTADGGQWDSGVMGKDDTFSYTFNSLGTFTYVCSIHPSMTGTIEVVEVIPEFSSLALVVLGMLVVVLAVSVLRKRR